MNARGQGGRIGPLAGSRNRVPVGVRATPPKEKGFHGILKPKIAHFDMKLRFHEAIDYNTCILKIQITTLYSYTYTLAEMPTFPI